MYTVYELPTQVSLIKCNCFSGLHILHSLGGQDKSDERRDTYDAKV